MELLLLLLALSVLFGQRVARCFGIPRCRNLPPQLLGHDTRRQSQFSMWSWSSAICV